MPDLDDLLGRDGRRWRDEVDRRHVLDPEPSLEQITSSDSGAPGAWRQLRFGGRAPLLLSAAAVTVAALAVGGVVAFNAGRRIEHPSPPALGTTATSRPASPTASLTPSPARTARRSTTAHRPGAGGDPATTRSASQHKRHPTKHRRPTGAATSDSTAPAACDPAVLTVSIASTSSGDSAFTLSVVNAGSASCTVSGSPTVQLRGDDTITATSTAEAADPVTLAAGATATAAVDTDGGSDADTCPSYSTAIIAVAGGEAAEFPLDPAVQVCDGATLVVHPFTAG